MIRALAAASVLAGLLTPAPAQRHETPLARSYRALVDAYRGGRADHAVGGVLTLDPDELEAVVRSHVQWVRNGFDLTLDADFFRAASTLHADAAVRCWREDRPDEAELHLDLGRILVDASEPHDEGPNSFRRRWYAAGALVVADHAAPPRTIDYFEMAVERVPGDAPLLTAAGWFSERLADGAAGAGTTLRAAQAARRRHQRSAERYFAAALDADPRAEEAALRLARIESLMGRQARAAGRLTALLARNDLQPFTAYLARLFLGGIRAREGRDDDAARLFREAIELHPNPQSARIALAESRYAAGDSAGAADAIQPLATPAAERPTNDPWSDYQLAYPQVGLLILDELRDEVQR
jgi:tetratricopeptide (TPR) repeat protein